MLLERNANKGGCYTQGIRGRLKINQEEDDVITSNRYACYKKKLQMSYK